MRRSYLLPLFALITSAMFAQDITLVKPPAKLGVDVLDAIRMRAAARAFVKKDLSVADLSTIMWAANGLKGTPDAVSTASKAGSTIPVSGDFDYINVYALTAKGAFRYEPAGNVLKSVNARDVRTELTPESIPTAALMVLFTVDNDKAPSFFKSNPGMFREIADATASYGAQNVGLVTTGLRMSSIVMYNIKPDAIAADLKLSKDESPLFIMQLGYNQ
jgi:hypothetical protein